jgi:hypothetical protein
MPGVLQAILTFVTKLSGTLNVFTKNSTNVYVVAD